MSSGRNYGRSSVMTDQISNLTKQSFPNNFFSSGVVSDVEVYKADTSEAMEKVCKFVYFKVIILTFISILTSFSARLSSANG